VIKAVVFDMYETLVTVFDQRPYYSAEMAHDAGVSVQQFRSFSRSYEQARTLGQCDLQTALKGTLNGLGIDDEPLLQRMIEKRTADQKRIFHQIDPAILSMLRALKVQGIRLGLISNCYLEERDLIRTSELAGFFDVMLLSCGIGIRKPDAMIFQRCMDALALSPNEILYVGDGGSDELEAASALGMRTVQACWFIREDEPDQPCGRKDGFPHAESPASIIQYVYDSVREETGNG